MDIKRAIENQKEIFDMLKKTKENNRLSHAYLFYGDKGTGKKEMAYALACMMYCKNGGCLTCDTCKTIIEGNHLNIDYIGIDENKTMISKEQINALQEEFSKTSLVDGVRIYIVDGIDTASTAAQNSLLKFIEDPQNKTETIGIFLATDLSNVVNTIKSRCILEHFKSLSVSSQAKILNDMGIDELDSILVSSITNDIDLAKNIALSDEFLIIKNIFLEMLDLKTDADKVYFYLKYQNVFSVSENLDYLISWFILFIEDSNIYMNNSSSLILYPLCDKIKMYKNKYNNVLKDKMKLSLEEYNKIKYNVIPKNIFHEFLTKVI